MKLIFLGAPGAGKGTQADQISDRFSLPVIGTGNIIREAVKNQTPAGVQAKSYMDSGSLVPDEIVIGMLQDRISQDDCKNGFILDGFPRTVPQAEALDNIAHIDAVVELAVEDQQLVDRLSGRRVCLKCGATNHVSQLNGRTQCDCGEPLVQRDDDKPETVLSRLKVYHDQTAPLVDFYEKKGLLHRIDGAKDRDAIYADILNVLGAKA